MKVIGKDPEALEELHQIADANGGALKPTDVVERAEDKSSALHVHFEWDDSKAAYHFRIEQARSLIQQYRIVSNGGPPTRYWINVTTPDHEYRKAEEVIQSEVLLEQHLKRLETELRRLRNELAGFKKFAKVVSAIDKALPKAG